MPGHKAIKSYLKIKLGVNEGVLFVVWVFLRRV